MKLKTVTILLSVLVLAVGAVLALRHRKFAR